MLFALRSKIWLRLVNSCKLCCDARDVRRSTMCGFGWLHGPRLGVANMTLLRTEGASVRIAWNDEINPRILFEYEGFACDYSKYAATDDSAAKSVSQNKACLQNWTQCPLLAPQSTIVCVFWQFLKSSNTAMSDNLSKMSSKWLFCTLMRQFSTDYLT